MDEINLLIDTIVEESRASQNKEELRELLRILKDCEIKNIVEIGVHQGYSLEVWKKMFPDANVIGVDNDLHALDFEATKDCIIIDADSHDTDTQFKVQSYLKHGLIDFLFIDGDHSYEGVKRDWQMYIPLVRKGGIIALHDACITDNDSVDVYKFWEEIKVNAKIGYRTIHLGGTGVGVVIV